MLELPADDIEKFIAENAAAGTPVENMPLKKLRQEIRQWNDSAKQPSGTSPAIDNVEKSKEKSISDAKIHNESTTNSEQSETLKCGFTLQIEPILAFCDNVLKLDDSDKLLREYVKNNHCKVETELSNLQKFIEQIKTTLKDPSEE